MNPSSLDHVALWVTDPDPLASFVCEHLAMHVIERTDQFTLVGVDAKLGKLTLFAAEGPRERGALERVVLRVRDLEDVVLRVADPEASAETLAELGFERRNGRLAIEDRELRLAPGGDVEGER